MSIAQKKQKQIFEDWVNQSEADSKKDFDFLDSLRSYPPAQVATTAQAADKEAYTKIDCGNCANCCKRLKPDLEETDITRISTFLNVPPSEFAEDFDRLTENNKCLFLDTDNRCKIYDIRPLACRDFPNTQKKDFTTRITDHKNNLDTCPITYFVVQRMQENFKLES